MCTLPIKLDILGEHLFHSDKIVVIAKMYVGQLHGAASIKISFNARLELLLMRVELLLRNNQNTHTVATLQPQREERQWER